MGNDAGSGWLHLAAQFIEHFLASLWALLQALPEAPAAHARALAALLGTGGRPLALTLLLTGLSLAALFAPGAAVRARPFESQPNATCTSGYPIHNPRDFHS